MRDGENITNLFFHIRMFVFVFSYLYFLHTNRGAPTAFQLSTSSRVGQPDLLYV
jgi:hypothetical protein